MVLLPTDPVILFKPAERDAHGWRQARSGDAYWSGMGALQLSAGPSDPRAADGGGHGPHEPARELTGDLYLPQDAQPRDGMSAVIRGRNWVLSQVRFIHDPSGGLLHCWVAFATTAAAEVTA